MNMKDMLSKLNKIDSKQPLNEEVVNGAPVVEQPKTQVAEDIALNADGEDAMHLILKLAGLPTDDAPSSDLGAPSLDIAPAPISSPMSIEPVDSMRSSIDSMDALSGPADDLGGDDLSPMDVLGSDLDADMDSDLDADIDAELGEFANTPAGSSGPKTLGMDAATPSGNDLHRSKGMHKHSYQQGDNPLAMEELNKLEGKLKKMFESMSAEAPTDVKKNLN